ncbi:MAG: exodeoxyribonuclease VII small subunit [Campylobacterota bacterium]|nr:exodeoxyribonuclease VII small subunit [Campylobacterota bacterium]
MSEEKQEISFESKIDEAKKLLDTLLDPQITLSNSVEVYKKGMAELQSAQELLDDAKLQFEELNKA